MQIQLQTTGETLRGHRARARTAYASLAASAAGAPPERSSAPSGCRLHARI